MPFSELLHLVPNMRVVLSLRNAKSWAKSRYENHNGTQEICHPRHWNDTSFVRHPFDLVRCLQKAAHAHESANWAVVRISSLPISVAQQMKVLEAAYAQLSTLTAVLSYLHDRKLSNFLPLCVFDEPSEWIRSVRRFVSAPHVRV